MISQTAEYALRAIVLLAHRQGRPCTAQQLSDASNIPVMYLSKILGSLVRDGLVQSQRGPGGGFLLSQEPKDVTMYDVLAVVEPIKHYCECPLSDLGCNAPGPELCPLHRRLQAVGSLLEQSFRETTIADLMAEGAGNLPFCHADATGAPPTSPS